MRKLFFLIDKLDRRVRLLISLFIGIGIFMLTRNTNREAISFMLAWIGFCITVLFFLWITILAVHPREIAVVADEQDAGRVVGFVFIVSAAIVSLFAIIILLQTMPRQAGRGLNRQIILSGASVVLSWLLIHSLFTIRYAHIYYRYRTVDHKMKEIHHGGLEFPGHELPDFPDFAYFSFVLGMTFQVSDVVITSRHIRRLALLHGFLSFVYNTVIVALSINIISTLISKS